MNAFSQLKLIAGGDSSLGQSMAAMAAIIKRRGICVAFLENDVV